MALRPFSGPHFRLYSLIVLNIARSDPEEGAEAVGVVGDNGVGSQCDRMG